MRNIKANNEIKFSHINMSSIITRKKNHEMNHHSCKHMEV